MQRVLELYASLIDYPNELFLQESDSLQEYMQELGNTEPILEQLQLFYNLVEKLTLTELQELYTPTFDLSPVCSPHVGFHIFGESYKRGALMAKLSEEYRHVGLLNGVEIPDHLANLLRYCAILSENDQEHEAYKEVVTLLVIPGVEKMVASFAETTNPYKYIIGSLSGWLIKQYESVAS